MGIAAKKSGKLGEKFTKVKVKKYTLKYTVSAVRLIFMIGMCFVVLFPLFRQIVSSIMHPADLYDATVTFIPKNLTAENFVVAWNTLGGWQTFLRSIALTVVCSTLIVASSTLTGYGLARFSFRMKGVIFGLVILALVLPSELLFTPRFMMFVAAEQIDTWVPMLLFAATSTGLRCSLYIFLMRQFFKGQPRELEEAAYVDGAGPFQTFVKIMLPGAVAMMVTVFLFSFVWQWLDSSYTAIFMRNISLISTRFGGLNVNHGLTGALREVSMSLTRAAGVMIIMAPLVLLYSITQRFFVESISRSGITGM